GVSGGPHLARTPPAPPLPAAPARRGTPPGALPRREDVRSSAAVYELAELRAVPADPCGVAERFGAGLGRPDTHIDHRPAQSGDRTIGDQHLSGQPASARTPDYRPPCAAPGPKAGTH